YTQNIGYLGRLVQLQKKQGNVFKMMKLSEEALRMKGEAALLSSSVMNKFWHYIESSKKDSKYATAASNALTALNLVGYNFSGKDLSYVNAPGANLSRGLFYKTNFTGAIFTNVNFRLAHFGNALLAKAHLEGANFGGQFHLKIPSYH